MKANRKQINGLRPQWLSRRNTMRRSRKADENIAENIKGKVSTAASSETNDINIIIILHQQQGD